MFTKQNFIDSIRKELGIILHLHSKVTPQLLDYRPSPKQRSLQELLEFLPLNGHLFATLFFAGSFEPFKTEGPKLNAAARADFPGTMTAETEKLIGFVQSLSEQDMAKPVQTPAGDTIPFGAALVNMNLKFYTAYRMQLFLYLKAAGLPDLNTSNCWRGQDPAPKK